MLACLAFGVVVFGCLVVWVSSGVESGTVEVDGFCVGGVTVGNTEVGSGGVCGVVASRRWFFCPVEILKEWMP